MSTNELEVLQSGLHSFKQGLYLEAINSLEHFCQICRVNGKTNCQEYLRAQIALVQAFHHTKNQEAARTIAQELLTIQNPQIIAWAKKFLESLPVETATKTSIETNSLSIESTPESTPEKPTLTTEEGEKLLKTGKRALNFHRYPEAVQSLEEFCQRADDTVKYYNQARMWLVKAYKGNEQLEEAIALCKQLTTIQQESTSLWAIKVLATLVPESEISQLSTPEDSTTPATNSAQVQSTSTHSQTAAVEMKMKTLEEFKSFCQQNLLTDLENLDAARKQVLIFMVIVNIIIAIIFFSNIHFLLLKMIISTIINHQRIPLVLMLVFLVISLGCLWGWVAVYTSSTETYSKGFKSKITRKIFEFINQNDSLSYSAIPSQEDDRYVMSGFANSQMFQTLLKANKITQNDCIYGKVGEIPIYFSEVSAQFEIQHIWAKYFDFRYYLELFSSYYIPRFIRRIIFGFMLPFYVIVLAIQSLKGIPYVVSKMSRGRKIDYQNFKEEVLNNEVSRKLIFKGLFFQANFPKTLKSKTIVVPNLVNININALPKTTRQIVKLEDPQFNEYFTVYANDQVEARYVLSTNLMEKLVKFRQKARKNIYVSFIDNMIYIGIEYGEDIFEPQIFKSMLNFAPMRQYFENIQLMLGIVEDLNLHRRIWR